MRIRTRPNRNESRGEHLRGTHPIQRTNPFQGGSYPEYGDRESPDKGPSPKSHDSDRETYDTEGEQWEQSPPVTPFPYGVTQDYPSLPTLEDLQQDHDIEMQSLQQHNHEQQQEHENALLQLNQMHAKALKTQKETLLRSRNVRISGELPQQHHNENKHDPSVEIQPQIGHIHSHGTTKGREHSPNTPWLHVPRGASRSPTRSHVSMDSLDAKIHDTRKVANLKHIKIEIVQLVTNSNELEWRKSVTASTAALKTPHLLEGNHRAYTHAKLKELYDNLGLDLPTRYQSPSKNQPPAAHKQTKPEWWVEATKAKGDTFAQSANSYTDRLIEQDLLFVVVWVALGDDSLPAIESEYDSACRTFLFTHMKKSLKAYAHMTKNVVHGDCRALFNAVVLQQHPEPRQLLVSCFNQLVEHKKTLSTPFQPWIGGLNDIFNTLETVDFALESHVRLGFTMSLLGHDKRYTTILEKAQEKEWSND